MFFSSLLLSDILKQISWWILLFLDPLYSTLFNRQLITFYILFYFVASVKDDDGMWYPANGANYIL